MAICALCEKKFQDRRGLHGHFRFVHGIEYGSGRPAKKTALTEATKRVIERKKKEKELIEDIKGGEFELTPRSEIERKGKREEGRLEDKETERNEGFNLKGLKFALDKEARQNKGISLKGLSGRWLNGER